MSNGKNREPFRGENWSPYSGHIKYKMSTPSVSSLFYASKNIKHLLVVIFVEKRQYGGFVFLKKGINAIMGLAINLILMAVGLFRCIIRHFYRIEIHLNKLWSSGMSCLHIKYKYKIGKEGRSEEHEIVSYCKKERGFYSLISLIPL